MKTPNKRGVRVAIASICALSLVAAACGSDDDGADDDTATETSSEVTTEATDVESTTAPDDTASESTEPTDTAGDGGTVEAPTGSTVKIGVIYAETGRTGGTYDTIDDVALAWADWVNSEMGGVDGHVVEIVAVDDESTGEGAAAAARELVESEGVVGIVIQDSAAEIATVDYLAEQGVPYIGGTANNRPIDGGDSSWPNTHFVTSPSNPGTAAMTMLAAESIGATAYGAAVCAEVPACAEAGNLYGPVAEGLNLDYVGLVTVGAADPSYTAPCLELIGLGADFINLGLAGATALSLIDECDLQGYDGVWGAANNTVVASQFEAIDDLHLAGGLNGFPWWAEAAPAQTYRDVTEGAGVDGRNPSATSTWSALELFRSTLDQYGPGADAEITVDDVIAAYHSIDGETLDGLLPSPISYVTEGPQPVVPCFWLFDSQGGEYETITLGESGNGATGGLESSCFSFG